MSTTALDFKKVVRVGTLPTHGGGRVSVFCTVALRDGRLSITGVIGPRPSGNAYGGSGQIDMEFAHRDGANNDSRTPANALIPATDFSFAPGWDADKWLDFLDVWKRWHLNDMRPSADGKGWEREELPTSVATFLADLPVADRPHPWGG